MLKTFYIETFGCQMNVHDSEKVAGTLLRFGYQPVDNVEEADLVFYNTCSIREKAAQKVFSRLGQFRKARAEGKIFGVLGCVAQQEGEKIFEAVPHVNLVVGSASYNRLPELLAQLERGGRRLTGLSLDTDQTFETEFTRRENPFRAYITIIEGCDKHCAYCVVPFTRGPERSRTSRSVIEETRRLAGDGYTEIQLLGQNVNSYRDPSPSRVSFAELLTRVAEVPGIRRVRFTTSHPRDFCREIVAVLDSRPVLCNHVHLPVQSGSTRVLAAMRRRYTRAEYLDLVARIRAAIPNVTLSTDMIVGFPGETAADFEETLSLVEAVQYHSMFSFKYSARPNTLASRRMADDVSEPEKTARILRLQALQRGIQTRLHEHALGTTVDVLVDAASRRRSGEISGRTTGNTVVNFPPPPLAQGRRPAEWIGSIVPVTIRRAGPNSVWGEAAGASGGSTAAS